MREQKMTRLCGPRVWRDRSWEILRTEAGSDGICMAETVRLVKDDAATWIWIRLSSHFHRSQNRSAYHGNCTAKSLICPMLFATGDNVDNKFFQSGYADIVEKYEEIGGRIERIQFHDEATATMHTRDDHNKLNDVIGTINQAVWIAVLVRVILDVTSAIHFTSKVGVGFREIGAVRVGIVEIRLRHGGGDSLRKPSHHP